MIKKILISLAVFSLFSFASPTLALQETQTSEPSITPVLETASNEEMLPEEEILTQEEQNEELVPLEKAEMKRPNLFRRTGRILKILPGKGLLVRAGVGTMAAGASATQAAGSQISPTSAVISPPGIALGRTFRVDVTRSTIILEEGEKIGFGDLKVGDKIRVYGIKHPKLSAVKATLIRVIPGHRIAIKGTIQEISATSFLMTTPTGRSIRVDVNSKTLIIKNGKKATLGDLVAGDKARVFGIKHPNLPLIKARLVVVKTEPLIGLIEKVLSPGSFLFRSGGKVLRVDLDPALLKAKKNFLKNLVVGKFLKVEGVAHSNLPIIRVAPSGLLETAPAGSQ